MRWLSLLVLGLGLIFGLLLTGCSGEEEQAQQAEPVQEEVEQTAASTETTTERSTVNQESAEQPTAQDEQGESEDGAAESTTTQSSQAAPSMASDPLFAEAARAYESWSASLETMEMAIEVDFDLGLFATELSGNVALQLEPFMVHTTIDATSLFEMTAEFADGDQDLPDEPLIMQVLLSEDAAYMAMSGLDGWIDLSSELDATLEQLALLLGLDLEELTEPSQFGQAFGCVEAVGGSISESNLDGESVWLIDCQIDVDALTEAAAQLLAEEGMVLADAGVETMHLRLAISQVSGAPLLIETESMLADQFGMTGSDDDDAPQLYVLSTSRLVSWNEPLTFPAPEPLVDGSLLGFDTTASNGASPGSDSSDGEGSEHVVRDEPGELLEAGELLHLAEHWLEAVADLEVHFITHAVIDDEPRQVSSSVLVSRSEGMFEVATSVDDSVPFRLLWNRDGIWVSESVEDGVAIWEPSNPVLLGLGGSTVDEFLASPDRYSLHGYASLVDLAWVSRTIEGSGPPIYEIGFESGPLTPESPHFDSIAALLRFNTTELLSENVMIDRIEYFSATITINGNTGAVLNAVSEAEFQTTSGFVALTTTDNLREGAPLAFSQPTK